jgi:hypothetical protein
LYRYTKLNPNRDARFDVAAAAAAGAFAESNARRGSGDGGGRRDSGGSVAGDGGVFDESGEGKGGEPAGRGVTPGCQIGYMDYTGCHQLNRVLTQN